MRIALIIGVWLVALTGGALLYIARQAAESADYVAETPAASMDPASDPLAIPTGYDEGGRISFSMPDVAGESRLFSEWDGKYRVLNFWATWCAPCRREIPLLKAFQDGAAGDDIQVIGIAVDFQEEVERYAEAADFNYPVLVGQEDAMALAESSGVPFMGLPFTMIISRDGRLIDTHMGEIFEDDLAELVETLERLDSGAISVEEAREIL